MYELIFKVLSKRNKYLTYGNNTLFKMYTCIYKKKLEKVDLEVNPIFRSPSSLKIYYKI